MKTNRLPLVVLTISSLVFASVVGSFWYIIHYSGLRQQSAAAQSGDVSWGIFNGGGADQGANYHESVLNTSNVSNLVKLWEVALPANADNAPVEAANVNTAGGIRDLVFVNTVKGNLVAYDASTGAKVWEADPSSSNYNGQGTKSSPAVDPSGNYIYAYALDGYIHRYNIASGAEVAGGGFPAQATLLPNDTEKGSASLNIANGYLYMTLSGNDGDYGHYVGHVVAINLSSGAETVWNAECANIAQLLTNVSGQANYCANTMSGIWARPGVTVDPVTGNVFVATGNGLYDANSSGNDWGDSIVELNPSLSTIVDSYTPASYSSLQSGDADLGSTAPVMLPTQSGSNTPYMLVQAGKDHIVRLLNRANLSGAGGPRHTGGELQTITISNEVHEQPATWVDGSGTTWVYVSDESNDLYAYRLVTSGGVSSLSQAWQVNVASSSPFVANGVVYLTGSQLVALNATTGAELMNSSSLGISMSEHWESPIVVNGIVFTNDNAGNLFAFYVPGATSTPPPSPPSQPSNNTTTGSSTPATKTGSSATSSTTKTVTSTTPSSTTTQETGDTPTNTTGTTDTTYAAVGPAKTHTGFLAAVAGAIGLRKVDTLLHGNRLVESGLLLVMLALAAGGIVTARQRLSMRVMAARQGSGTSGNIPVGKRLRDWFIETLDKLVR